MFRLLVLLFGLIVGVFGANTVCDDEKECYNEDIESENVYCRGYLACYEATIVAEEKAYLYGQQGAQEAKVTTYDFYCRGFYSCYLSEIDASNDGWCIGDLACRSAEIDYEDDLVCDGRYGCYAAEIDGGQTLYARGIYSLIYSEISGPDKIYGYGYLGLGYADIYSGGCDDELMYIYAYGRYASYYTEVYCESGDTCYIYCKDTGCYDMTVYSYSDATVYTSCSDDCDDCPEVEYSNSKEEDAKFEARKLERRNLKKQLRAEFDKELDSMDGLLDEDALEKIGQKYFPIKEEKEQRLNVEHDVKSSSPDIDYKVLGAGVLGGVLSTLAVSYMIKCINNKKEVGYQKLPSYT